jgi:hypothetical protein
VVEMKREDTVAYFVEAAKNDFSLVEKNLTAFLLELRQSEQKKLNYVEAYDAADVLRQVKELKDAKY